MAKTCRCTRWRTIQRFDTSWSHTKKMDIVRKNHHVRNSRAISDAALSQHVLCRHFKTSAEIIQLSVMLYVRFPLSLRNVEDLLSRWILSMFLGIFWKIRTRLKKEKRKWMGIILSVSIQGTHSVLVWFEVRLLREAGDVAGAIWGLCRWASDGVDVVPNTRMSSNGGS